MRNDSVPLMRKPIHQAPTHCGSSGVRWMLYNDQPTTHNKHQPLSAINFDNKDSDVRSYTTFKNTTQLSKLYVDVLQNLSITTILNKNPSCR